MYQTHLFLFLTKILTSTCLTFISDYNKNTSLQVQLPDGLIQGRLKHTIDIGMPYYSYEGIPYAKPPVGKLRFEPPQPPEKWDGVLNADGNVPVCFQIPSDGGFGDVLQDEDCLYINVYVPISDELKAVMVWIYGGAFMMGQATAELYGPDFLLEKGVIVAHFNYRLNVFGFLSTEDLASPGNYGLKDQQLALRWIQSNIHNFGGDPERITIFGQSAGAASVGYHLIQSNSNLFQRAISESGSTLCSWTLQTNPFNIARKIAAITGLHFGSSDSIVAHLKKLNARELRNAAAKVAITDSLKVLSSGLTFAPVLEPEHENAFLTKSTFELLKSGKFIRVPYLLGFNSMEVAMLKKIINTALPVLSILPNDVLISSSLNNQDSRIGDKIKKYYFSDNKKSKAQQYIEFYSDVNYNRPIIETARLFSNYSQTYMYLFAYEGFYLGRKGIHLRKDDGIEGVSHSEELWYIFANKDLNYANSTDKLIRDRMTTLWTNFAKNGNPNFENFTWPVFKPDDYSYLNIDRELTIGRNYKAKTMKFWRDLYARYRQPPFNTY